MSQQTIGQRLKFLMETLNLKVRAFSHAIDVSETNIRNYITRESKPSSDIIERILLQYPQVNAAWLLTGQGDPFLPNSTPSSDSHNISTKNFQGNVAGTNHGNMTQSVGANGTLPDCEKELAASRRENELLKQQLLMAEALIASKDETLALLRGSRNNPN